MARGSYSFNLLDLYRLDLFLEQAWGRDRDVARGLAAGDRPRRRRELTRAMEYDPARGGGEELPAVRLSGRRIDNVPDSAAETLTMMMMRADLHVHTLHSTRSGNMRFLRSRDCYSRPIDVYRTRQVARHGSRRHYRPRQHRRGARACGQRRESRRGDHRRRSVVLVQGHPGAPRRVRHDRGAAPRHSAAAPERVRRDRVSPIGRACFFR